METISYTAARNNLAKIMDGVIDDHEPVLITRQKGPSVVLISLRILTPMKKPPIS
jgi:antitoxin YefM